MSSFRLETVSVPLLVLYVFLSTKILFRLLDVGITGIAMSGSLCVLVSLFVFGPAHAAVCPPQPPRASLANHKENRHNSKSVLCLSLTHGSNRLASFIFLQLHYTLAFIKTVGPCEWTTEAVDKRVTMSQVQMLLVASR